MGAKNRCEISRLPQDCLSRVISLTSPPDACRCSVVSTFFRSAADADAVWENFLPADIDDILSRIAHRPAFSTKKDLYFHLSDNDVLIDHGKMSFRLERSRGAKTYMLSPTKAVSVAWGDNPQYWQTVPHDNSRFLEVRQLILVWWFDISTNISCKILTPKTSYAIYFVFKLEDDSIGFDLPIESTVGFRDQETDDRIFLLQGSATRQLSSNLVRYPQVRDDQWNEVQVGEFYNDGEDDDTIVHFRVAETNNLGTKRGLIFYGFEIRPHMKSAG